MSSWQVVLLEPARAVLAEVSQFLVNLLLVAIILIVGWVISKAIMTIVSKALKAIKLDKLADRLELTSLLKKGGVVYSLSDLIGVICYWIGILITAMVAINAIGLTVAASLLNTVVLYVPHVIAAVFILVLGMFAATLLKTIVQTAASNAGLSQGKMLGQLVEIIVVIFAIFVGLEQLGIGIHITELTLAIILGSVGLGLALAFGLGCKDLAGKSAAEFIERLKKK